MTVVQAEFSALNTNYLIVLLKEVENGATTNYLKVYSLES